MNTISFKKVVPDVFRQRIDDLQSEVWNADATFKKGHLYLVEAESGRGKSTFCSYVLGYRHDYTGEIFFDDRNVRSNNISDWVDVRCRKVSLLFQELRLFPELTAMENVVIKNKLEGNFKSTDEINTWFERLGIADKKDTRLGLMSYGQQQRVAMMRALVQPFDFIIADEPISHLDDRNSTVMADIMMTEAKRQGAGVIVTSIGKHMNLEYEKVFRL